MAESASTNIAHESREPRAAIERRLEPQRAWLRSGACGESEFERARAVRVTVGLRVREGRQDLSARLFRSHLGADLGFARTFAAWFAKLEHLLVLWLASTASVTAPGGKRACQFAASWGHRKGDFCRVMGPPHLQADGATRERGVT